MVEQMEFVDRRNHEMRSGHRSKSVGYTKKDLKFADMNTSAGAGR